MKKYLTLIGLLMVFSFGLAMFSGCAEKQAVVKDESVQEQKAVSAQAAPVKETDDEVARRAKEQTEREAALKAQAAKEAREKKNAAALNDLNIQNIYFDYDKSNIRSDAFAEGGQLHAHAAARGWCLGSCGHRFGGRGRRGR